MTLPELMCKMWDGDDAEYFTWLDMSRVEYNANTLAAEVGVDTVDFIEVTRSGQFRYDEAQKLEDLLAAVALKLGITIPLEDAWSYNRAITFADFERWESGFWTLYTALGGTGERIPAGKVMVTYAATLFASGWKGAGPYYYDLTMPGILASTDAMAYIAHTATDEQRADEFDALLKAQTVSARLVRVWATKRRPAHDLPLRLSIGGFHLHQELSLPASGWSGDDDGPWTQTVTLSSVPVNAVIGAHGGMTDAQVQAMMAGMISVSAIDGTSVTIRAIGEKPTIALNPVVMWETSESE